MSKFGTGRHLLIECYGTQSNQDAEALEGLICRAAAAGGAKVLSCHMHAFGNDAGVTGVALLAESHIAVHTWPEQQYAAFDIFMCGDCDADAAAAVIADANPGEHVRVKAIDRPIAPDAGRKP